jgi:hypothetical protein
MYNVMYMSCPRRFFVSVKVRKQVYLEPEQEVALKRLAQQTGMSEAEIIRQALDRQTRLQRFWRRDRQAWESELAFMEGLLQQGSVVVRRTWRREDLYGR